MSCIKVGSLSNKQSERNYQSLEFLETDLKFWLSSTTNSATCIYIDHKDPMAKMEVSGSKCDCFGQYILYHVALVSKSP